MWDPPEEMLIIMSDEAILRLACLIKNVKQSIMQRTGFSREVVTNISFHFSKLDIYFCPFSNSDAISFLKFIKF